MGESIKACEPQFYGNELKYVEEAIRSGWISGNGPFCKKLEQMMADYAGMKHGIAVCNGTAAIHLGLRAMEIGPGDEVIMPALAPVFCSNPILWCGARPRLVDIDKDTWNIDINKIESHITSSTKAIMAVHLYGMPCDMDVINDIAFSNRLFMLEDFAEAIGSEWKGRMCGSFGDVSCTSFYANKAVTTAEGGMVLTDCDAFAERARLLRNQGRTGTTHFMHPEIGYNYRLADVLAAIGCAQMEHVAESVDARMHNATVYEKHLEGVEGVTLPPKPVHGRNSYWMYTILVENRDEVIRKLAEKGIETRAAFHPLHLQPCYKDMPFAKDKEFPVAEHIAAHGMNLPSGNLLTKDQIRYVCDCLKDALAI